MTNSSALQFLEYGCGRARALLLCYAQRRGAVTPLLFLQVRVDWVSSMTAAMCQCVDFRELSGSIRQRGATFQRDRGLQPYRALSACAEALLKRSLPRPAALDNEDRGSILHECSDISCELLTARMTA